MMNEPKPMDFGRISSNFKADSSFHGLGMGQPSKIWFWHLETRDIFTGHFEGLDDLTIDPLTHWPKNRSLFGDESLCYNFFRQL